MQLNALIRQTRLLPSEYRLKRDRDLAYLMELKEENLLFPYYTEAGLNGRLNYRPEPWLHGGWDSPLSQIRGTFTGHWLSAAARLYQETGDIRLKAKADYIVAEIGRCQEANGGEWAFPIPEKYLQGLKQGRHFWAPQYVCHKVMMGLLDMYQYADNRQALQILEGCAAWFSRFAADISRETMDDMMDLEETGGLMELWADLYGITRSRQHLELMRKYERPRLTGPLLEGRDILTNMHANATIPEIHGCARAYEVTREERYLRIVESYWRLAVDDRPPFATGGQTDAETWAPPGKQAARLSDMNQEHCVVYNMIRLADYLYRWTGEKKIPGLHRTQPRQRPACPGLLGGQGPGRRAGAPYSRFRHCLLLSASGARLRQKMGKKNGRFLVLPLYGRTGKCQIPGMDLVPVRGSDFGRTVHSF